MTNFNLSYSGRKTVTSNPNQQAHELLNALFSVHEAENGIAVDVGQVRPQESKFLLVVSLSASADMAKLETIETSLAQSLVELGVEPDTETATESIQINST
jgi:hypothetical protein